MRRLALAFALLLSACQTGSQSATTAGALGETPVTFNLPAGSRIDAECVYDNSAANPRNPSKPPRRVTSGFSAS